MKVHVSGRDTVEGKAAQQQTEFDEGDATEEKYEGKSCGGAQLPPTSLVSHCI